MIVDQAAEDCEMVQDPFLEAGFTIPSELPDQDKVAQKDNQKDNEGLTAILTPILDNNEKNDDSISLVIGKFFSAEF